jgi:hypothetical protein
MKKFLMVCCGVLFLQAVNALGQTNAAPAGRQPVSRGQSQGEKGASKLKNATPSVAPPQGSFRHSTEMAPSDYAAAIQRASREGLLVPTAPAKNYGPTLEGIFRGYSDQAGETCIRDTVITIFPTGR